MAKKTFRFSARLAPIKATFLNTVIFLPPEVVQALPAGRVRAKGTLNGAPFSLAPQFRKDGARYFSVSAALRKAAGIKEGDRVTCQFTLADPEMLDIPEELQAVLDQDPVGRQVWETFTTGLKRGLIHYVTSVKSSDSRIKRAMEIVEKSKTRSLAAQKKKD